MRILYLPRNQQRQFEKPKYNPYPVLMAMEATKRRNDGEEVYWNEPLTNDYNNSDYEIITQPEGLPFLSLPHPDRVWTRAKEYTSGNYKYLPGTHIMSASGCWWGKCSFCVENRGSTSEGTQEDCLLGNSPLSYQVRPVEDVISEIEECKKLGFKEVFDDSATFPMDGWLEHFISMYVRSDIGLRISANFRIQSNREVSFLGMYRCGFRMLLFGIESANQYTLDRINKGVKVEDIIPTIKRASDCGLEPHIAVIFGWEWESDAEALNTLRLVHYLLRKGFAKTAQASFICQQDIKGNESQRHFIRDIYGVWRYPDFWFNKIRNIRNVDDLKYFWRQIKVGIKEVTNGRNRK